MAGDVATPVPDSAIAVGLLGALLAIDSVAARAPDADGVKLNATVQLPPTATLAAVEHVPDPPTTNSDEPDAIELKLKAALPLLVRVTVCVAVVVPTVAEPKLSKVGDADTAGAVAVPDKLAATVVEGAVALCAMFSVALRVPAALGLNATCTVHELPAAMLPPAIQVELPDLV